ncbi:uncharacterized protein B0T15DRAFT_508787 [Chaetomium strumarium]|uniref:Uncharacterized protein n=1 Tax=Chaetomium strumarium TaxID=1170767 RepID=A0AAJ0GY39_9PEZI|nr:hypothetical protein B0T15DRAFT_508787 [Chaetomium strumarium]
MCTWNYLHHHHLPSCPRPIDMVVHYEYCFKATADPTTGETQPCNETYFADGGAALMNQVDYNDPCATGGCVISPDCSSGLCRLSQLGGRWVCCQCGGRGNEYRWCQHRMRTSPDTFCYHVCCDTCGPDPGGSSSSSASGVTSGTSGSGSGSSRRKGR